MCAVRDCVPGVHGLWPGIEVPEPEPGEGQAIVQIDRCGVCGSDVAAYRTGEPYSAFMNSTTFMCASPAARCSSAMSIQCWMG